MDPNIGLLPGLSRPKSNPPPSGSTLPVPLSSDSPPSRNVLSPAPRRVTTASWASSLMDGLFPPSFPALPVPPQVPHGIQPLDEAVLTADCLHQAPQSAYASSVIDNLAVFPAPSPSDPWHIAHVRVCAHANEPCAGCSAAFVCCSCRALRFTPGTPPLAPLAPPLR